MSKVVARVVGDIPANRLLWLYSSEDGKEMLIGLPKERGNYADFISKQPLKDGQEVTVNITGDPIWTVEAGTRVDVGANVSVDTDGRVGSYTSSPIRVGYSLDYGEEGDLVRVVRHPKVYLNNI